MDHKQHISLNLDLCFQAVKLAGQAHLKKPTIERISRSTDQQPKILALAAPSTLRFSTYCVVIPIAFVF